MTEQSTPGVAIEPRRCFECGRPAELQNVSTCPGCGSVLSICHACNQYDDERGYDRLLCVLGAGHVRVKGSREQQHA